MDLQALRTELDAGHPVTGAYSVNYAVAADQINALNITRIRATMAGSELLDATDPTEYNAKTDAQKSQWLSLCAIGSLDPASEPGKEGYRVGQRVVH